MQPNDIFGNIEQPQGTPGDLGNFMAVGIRIFFMVIAIILLIYLLWGAADWITSGGEKEKLEKARNKITHAIIGMLVAVAALAIFQVIAGDILGLIDTSGGGWRFNLPKLGP